MLTGIDHVIILGEDLDTAIAQYERLGFTVTPGGKHPRFTHNALVPFADGTYLELIAFYEHPEPESDETHRWHRHLSTGAGLVDFAAGATSVNDVQAAAGDRDVRMTGPIQGGRKRLDGIDIRWKSVVPEGENVGALPFVIEDQTERGLRVPGESADHVNGVRGIHSLVVAVRDVDTALDRYAGLLGENASVAAVRVERDDASGVSIMIGPHRVDLVTPAEDGPMQDLLNLRGDSVYELSLLAGRDSVIDPRHAANARIKLVSAP